MTNSVEMLTEMSLKDQLCLKLVLCAIIMFNLIVWIVYFMFAWLLLKVQLEIIWCWIPITMSSPSSIRAAMLVSSRSNSVGCWPEHLLSALKLWQRLGLVSKSTESISIPSNQLVKTAAIIESNLENLTFSSIYLRSNNQVIDRNILRLFLFVICILCNTKD